MPPNTEVPTGENGASAEGVQLPVQAVPAESTLQAPTEPIPTTAPVAPPVPETSGEPGQEKSLAEGMSGPVGRLIKGLKKLFSSEQQPPTTPDAINPSFKDLETNKRW